MARKVFISFLGTNNYVTCRYAFGSTLSQPVRFVQEALVAHLCREWTEDDRIMVFCTSKEKTGEVGSKEINWLDGGQPHADETECIGLCHRLEDLRGRIGLKAVIEQHDIGAGFSEEEIWDVFDTVYEQLLPGDQIYFDVTHAFRSIPLFSIVLFNYSRFMKETRLISIMYGAFEKLGPAFQIRQRPVEERVAPVIDMTNIARLQEYNQVASSLKDFGKVKRLGMAIDADRETASDQTVRNLSDAISELDEYIATIDLKEIKAGRFIQKFRSNYKNVRKKKKLTKPVSKILDELYRETSDFTENNSFRNIEAAINWTIGHDMLMQAYPLAEEYLILRVVDIFREMKPEELSQKEFRKFVSSILGMPEVDFCERNWKDTLAMYPDVADDIANDSLIRELRPLYDPLRRARNSLAHGNGSVKYDSLRKGIPNIIKCIAYINADYGSYSSTQEIIKEICS